MMEKIAVPTEGQKVASHFGHCSKFTICRAENGSISDISSIDNPGHRPGFLPGFLGEKGIDIVLAGGMGSRAINLFKQQGIEVVTGARGDVKECLNSYVNGQLTTEDNACDH